MLRSLPAFALALASLTACGPSKEPETPAGGEQTAADTAGGAGDAKPTETTGGDEAKPAGGEGDKTAEAAPKEPAKAASEAETLARDLVKSGGRRIGWSATKKMFAVPNEKRTGESFSIEILFYGEDGNSRDPMRICQPGECEERLDEILKELLPKLTSKLEEGGYVTLRSIGWPEGRDELEVSSLGMKLKYDKGRLEGVKEGKPKVQFTVAGGRMDAAGLKAIFLPPDSKLVGVFATPAKQTGIVQTFHVLKMP
jgi:hypothetical protein